MNPKLQSIQRGLAARRPSSRPGRAPARSRSRSLAIEPTATAGSQIRVKGQWLRLAGFPPGSRVHVTLLSAGVLELRLASVQPLPPGFTATVARLAAATAGAQGAQDAPALPPAA